MEKSFYQAALGDDIILIMNQTGYAFVYQYVVKFEEYFTEHGIHGFGHALRRIKEYATFNNVSKEYLCRYGMLVAYLSGIRSIMGMVHIDDNTSGKLVLPDIFSNVQDTSREVDLALEDTICSIIDSETLFMISFNIDVNGNNLYVLHVYMDLSDSPKLELPQYFKPELFESVNEMIFNEELGDKIFEWFNTITLDEE